MSVVGRLCAILEYKRPDILEELKKEIELNIQEDHQNKKVLTTEIISGFGDTNTKNS